MYLIACRSIHQGHERFILVMTLEEDRRFSLSNFCPFANGGAKISLKSFFMDIIFFLSAFSSSEVLDKNASIRSKLPTAAFRSREKREEGVKPICFMSKAASIPPENHSQYS